MFMQCYINKYYFKVGNCKHHKITNKNNHFFAEISDHKKRYNIVV